MKKNGEYNSELNTDENYIEQNLMFCLEIARRKLCQDNAGNIYDKFYDIPILDAIVIGLNLVNNKKNCSVFSFFGCFTGDGRKNIADTFKNKAKLDDKSLGKLKLEFYTKRIVDRVIQVGGEEYFKNDLFDLINNKKVIDKLIKQGITHCEPRENLKWGKQISPFIAQLEFKSSNGSDKDCIYKKTLQKISNKFNSKTPVYVLDGNVNKKGGYFLKFWEDGELDKRKNFDLRGLENSQGFLHATGKDAITRWFYLNKSNGTMYLLSETGAEQPNH